MKALKPLMTFGLLATFAFVVVGCNTMEGVGRDTERAGEAIQRGAN